MSSPISSDTDFRSPQSRHVFPMVRGKGYWYGCTSVPSVVDVWDNEVMNWINPRHGEIHVPWWVLASGKLEFGEQADMTLSVGSFNIFPISSHIHSHRLNGKRMITTVVERNPP